MQPRFSSKYLSVVKCFSSLTVDWCFHPIPFPCYHFDLSEPHLLCWQSRWGAPGLCTKHQPSWLCEWQHLLHGRPPTQIYNPWYLPEWQPLLSALCRKHENTKLKQTTKPENKCPNFPENSTRMSQIHWGTNSLFTKELQNNLIIFPACPDFVIAVLFPGVICIFLNHQGKSNFNQSDNVLFLNSTEV